MIEEKFNKLCVTYSDIYEHLPTIKKYASESEFIVELGVRGLVSTWALLAGKPKKMISVDIENPSRFGGDVFEVYDASVREGIDWEFILKSSLEIDLPEHDLLFIDTLHTYKQLSAELERHHAKVKKYIVMHDTALAGDNEMPTAVNEFLDTHPEWEVKEHFSNNNGLTVLSKILV